MHDTQVSGEWRTAGWTAAVRERDGEDERVAMAGDLISEGARRAAIGVIERTLGAAAERAAAAGPDVLQANARAPFELLPHDPGVVSRFIDRFQQLPLWTDEGACFHRAMVGAHLLDADVGLGAGPADDVFAAAIAISPHQHDGGTYTGGFHAGLAVEMPYFDEPQVIDLLPNTPRMQSLSAWSVSPDPMLLRPYAGTGLFDGVGYRSTWVGDAYFQGAAAALVGTWNAAEAYGVRVHGLGAMPPAAQAQHAVGLLRPVPKSLSQHGFA